MISKQQDICNYIKLNCQEEFNIINFAELYFCSLNQNYILVIILGSFFILFCFHFLASTAENYLTPSLIRLAKFLHLSDVIAGVTLLALANGAPDVITSFSSAGDEIKEGIGMSIGIIFGASLFAFCLILGIIAFQSSEIKIYNNIIIDIIFNIIADISLLILGITNSMNTFYASGFISLYGLKKKTLPLPSLENSNQKEKQQYEIEEEMIDYYCFDQKHKLQQEIFFEEDSDLSEDSIKQIQKAIQKSEYQNIEVNNSHNLEIIDSKKMKFQYSKNLQLAQELMPRKPITLKLKSYFGMLKIKNKLKQNFYGIQNDWSKLTFKEKLIHIYLFPLDFIRNYTIPCTDEENWVKQRAIFHPIFTFLFIIFSIGLFKTPIIFIAVGISFILSILILKFTSSENPPHFLVIFNIFSFISSILWIYFIANIMIDFLQLISILTKINKTLIGVTLIAIGNTLGDFYAISSLAKKGLGQMAISGIYSGQLFNVLIGFGFTLLRQCLNKGYLFIQFKNNNFQSSLI